MVFKTLFNIRCLNHQAASDLPILGFWALTANAQVLLIRLCEITLCYIRYLEIWPNDEYHAQFEIGN